MTKISIIVPARDEEETLGDVLRDINETLPQLVDYDIEVICVDDHSTDRTVEVAKSFGAKVVPNLRRSGKGMALRAGFEAAKGDILVMMDADYSHRPEDLPVFLAALSRRGSAWSSAHASWVEARNTHTYARWAMCF